jgi:ribosomal protein S18 acetylase RimI-like enzyme
MITTRRATPADVAQLRAMLQALSDHEGGPEVASREALLSHGFGPKPLFHAILAEEAGAALGMILFFPDFSTHRGEAGLYVQDIYVADAARGRGAGRLLIGAALRAQDWGARYVTLGVDPANRIAVAFYDRLGFRRRKYDYLILDADALEQP